MSIKESFEKANVHAVRANDHKKIYNLIVSDDYPNIAKEEKEKQVFNLCLCLLLFDTVDESIFKYLIFDYNIREEIYYSLDTNYRHPFIDELFAKRLTQELNKELPTNNENNKIRKI